MTKVKKQRSKHYEPKLAIKGSFEDVIKVAMRGAQKNNKQSNKQTVKK
jgi:hypothetical protein